MMKFVRPNRFFAYLEVQFEAVSTEQWVSSIPLKSLLARSVGPLALSSLSTGSLKLLQVLNVLTIGNPGYSSIL